MNGPNEFVAHLAQNDYHPRSDAHSNALCLAILRDLLEHCPALVQRAAAGDLVATLNHTVTVNYQDWNIDLALGEPAQHGLPPGPGEGIRFEVPATVELAVEAKGVMTEHGKARRNRLRDLQAFHSHAHQYDPAVVACGIVVVNVAPVFWSPTRDEDDITHHHNIAHLGPETVDLFRNLPLRSRPDEGPGLEAACVLVVDHDNIGKNPNPPAGAPPTQAPRLVEIAPAPQVGDPLHYATMIRRLCRAFGERWA